MKHILPALFLCLAPFSLLMANRPLIAHEGPPSVAAGQPLRLIARVSAGEPIESVNLHLSQSAGSAPVSQPMNPVSSGIYSITVNPNLFSGTSSFRYYIDAHTASGQWSETQWHTVRVIGTTEAREEKEGGGWQRPVLIGAGAVAVVGGGIAIANSGGGGGGDSPPPADGDPADQIIIRTANDNVNSLTPVTPKSITVDAADELAGRRIRRVRVRLEFDPVDAGPETFDVSYSGRVILSGTAQNAPRSDQVDVVGTADTQVTIRVLSSEQDEGTFTYRWNATVTFFLE